MAIPFPRIQVSFGSLQELADCVSRIQDLIGTQFNQAVTLNQTTTIVNSASTNATAYKLKIDGFDTTPDYLAAKLVAGDGITFTTVNPGSDEQIEVSLTPTTYVANEIAYGDPASTGKLVQSPDLTWTTSAQTLNITQAVSQTNPILNLVSTDATGADLYIQATTPGAAGKDEFCSWFYNSGSNLIGEMNFARLAGSGGGNNAIAWSLSAGTNANKQDFFALNGPVDTPLVAYTQLFDTFVGAPSHLATNAVNGFIWIPTVNGVPTGTPVFEGPAWPAVSRQPLVIDDVDKRLYFYNGSAWHYAAFNDGASGSGITALTGDVTATGPGSATATVMALSHFTSNGFVKTTSGTGTISIDTTSYQPALSLTTTDVLFAASSTTVGQDNLFNYDSTNHALAVGFSGSVASGTVGYFARSANSQTLLAMGNSNAGTSAIASVYATNNDTLTGSQVGLVQYGSAYTTSGLLGANVAQIIKSGTAANLLISNFGATGDIVFTTTTSTTERLRITSAGQITASGNVVGNADSTYNLGSASVRWLGTYTDAIYGNNTSHILTLYNDSGTSVAMALNSSGISVTGALFPSATTTYNLGTTSALWNNLYVTTVQGNGGSSLTLQDIAGGSPNTIVELTNSAISVKGNVLPLTTATYNLGSALHVWSSVFANEVLSKDGTPLQLFSSDNGSSGTGGVVTMFANYGITGNYNPTVGCDAKNNVVLLGGSAVAVSNIVVGGTTSAQPTYGASGAVVIYKASVTPTSTPTVNEVVLYVDGSTGSLMCRTHNGTTTVAT